MIATMENDNVILRPSQAKWVHLIFIVFFLELFHWRRNFSTSANFINWKNLRCL